MTVQCTFGTKIIKKLKRKKKSKSFQANYVHGIKTKKFTSYQTHYLHFQELQIKKLFLFFSYSNKVSFILILKTAFY